MGAALLAGAAAPALAAWAPSKTVQEIISAHSSATIGGVTMPVVTVVGGGEVPEGYPVTSTGNLILSQVADPVVLVTPLSLTQLGNQGVGLGLAYGEKAGLETESGLTYAANAKTNLVYQTVLGAQSTEEFLGKFPGDAVASMEQLIGEKIQAMQARLEQQLAQAQANGETETVAALQKQLEQLMSADYASVDCYAPLALFDVSASSALQAQLGEGDTVDVTVELNGVHGDSDVIALHFMGELEDCDAVMEQVSTDYANATVDLRVEVLDVEAGDGTATFTLSSFSPVMLMIRVEDQADPSPSVAPQEVPEDSQEQQAPDLLTWVMGAVAVVLLLAAALVAGKKNNTGKKEKQ